MRDLRKFDSSPLAPLTQAFPYTPRRQLKNVSTGSRAPADTGALLYLCLQ